ncbi:hypothetical protein M2360_004891 [Rhizobium sp. SG_E_25_P2]|uniref:hypothetical protein n=1 Tax=Rhizobium sp. SG_E_25_P2 TaxID=2879942 RepID=UPI00247302E5|nr:hypothetical protein [Rhizobium sp. SG_E_25_P2]MDH6269463.1 hypothetical protein [Rhizobium sp. SG_E_25_P2]
MNEQAKDASFVEKRVGLIGPPGSGKSFLFQDIADCVSRGLHGFAQQHRLSVQPAGEYRKFLRRERYQVPEATTDKVDARLELRYLDNGIEYREQVHTRDGPGELYFRNVDEVRPVAQMQSANAATGSDAAANTATLDDMRREWHEWLGAAEGLVLVASPQRITTRSFVSRVTEYVEDFTEEENLSGRRLSELQRIVITVTMFDLLLLPFGTQALNVALQPDAVLQILRTYLTSVSPELGDMVSYLRGQAKKKLDIRVLATSSYGFNLEFGCPNVDPDATPYAPHASQLPRPFDVDAAKRFPYMTADAFVFAATGLENEFLFPLQKVI